MECSVGVKIMQISIYSYGKVSKICSFTVTKSINFEARVPELKCLYLAA